MLTYIFAEATILIASLRIIQNWNAPLILSNDISISFDLLAHENI